MAIEAGADAIGLVSSMPSGPGVIPEDLIRAIAGTVPPPIATFLLTCHQRVDEIVAQQKRCGTNTVRKSGRRQKLCERIVLSTTLSEVLERPKPTPASTSRNLPARSTTANTLWSGSVKWRSSPKSP